MTCDDGIDRSRVPAGQVQSQAPHHRTRPQLSMSSSQPSALGSHLSASDSWPSDVTSPPAPINQNHDHGACVSWTFHKGSYGANCAAQLARLVACVLCATRVFVTAPSATNDSPDEVRDDRDDPDFSSFGRIVDGRPTCTQNSRHGVNQAAEVPRPKFCEATTAHAHAAVDAVEEVFKSWSKVPWAATANLSIEASGSHKQEPAKPSTQGQGSWRGHLDISKDLFQSSLL